ncbi:MAG: hypothetical protein ACXVR1_02155 [Solirubrobacteraceae bacterium]
MRAGTRISAFVLVAVALAGCGATQPAPGARTGAAPATQRTAAARLLTWTGRRHVRGVVDLSSPRRGGSIVVAAAGKLDVLAPGGGLTRFAPGYTAPPGLEPYIALSNGLRVADAGCRWPTDSVYALRLNHGDGVTVVDARGRARRFARLSPRGLEDGIAFDETGRFGHRLLVTSTAKGRSTIYAIDCRGRVTVLTRSAPRVEGGIAVAPSTFGRFAGDLVAPDELSGMIYAITPAGRTSVVARSGLPHGQDIGVESEGFVPARFTDALVADRHTARNRHPGDDLILRLSRAALASAGVRPGDLLAVTEGGAETIAARCGAQGCRVRHVANGPAIAHVEGHVVFSGA